MVLWGTEKNIVCLKVFFACNYLQIDRITLNSNI
jgi:hypothetical protein